MIWSELREETRQKLSEFNSDNAVFEADQIVFEAAGFERGDFHEVEDKPVTTKAVAAVDAMVERRKAGEPLQYVLGHWQFRHLDLMVDGRVLIPRPETEQVVDHAIAQVSEMSSPRVVDLGCGSGAIGLSIAFEVPDSQVLLTDVSEDALVVARSNLAGLGMSGTRVEIRQGSWFDCLSEPELASFDLIISNPPYIGPEERLDSSVVDWEPSSALRADDEGLADLKKIVNESSTWLRNHGVLVLEMAPWQVDPVGEIANHKFGSVSVFEDLSGLKRGLIAKKSD